MIWPLPPPENHGESHGSRGFALLGAIGLLLAVVVFPQLVGASGSYVVLSGSMHPTIHAGDVVVTRNVQRE